MERADDINIVSSLDHIYLCLCDLFSLTDTQIYIQRTLAKTFRHLKGAFATLYTYY